jgi:hypothetical protein
MERHRQFDHAKAGPEVAPGYGNGIDGLGPKLVRDLPQLLVLQFAQIRGGREGIEKRGRGSHYWNTFARFMLGDNAETGVGAAKQTTLRYQ